MNRIATSNRMLGTRLTWAVTTAMAGALLTGCASNAAPAASLSAGQAQQAMANGRVRQAISHGEAAVLAEPHNAAYRKVLGSAYLDAGRFASAATSFDDAMKLGDTSPSTALSLALALAGQGDFRAASTLLNEWENDIATADLGLALALSGQPERGIHVMGNAIRGGENTAKMRQNLAFAYALAGRWREARLMAAQDVPADQVGTRMEEWARLASPESWHLRVAGLLQVPAGVADAGQPVQLALANNPSIDQLAGEATAVAAADEVALPPLAVASAPVAELAPIASGIAPTPVPASVSNFQSAFTAPAPAPVAQDAGYFVRNPVVQAVPARAATASAAPAPRAVQPVQPVQQTEGTHLVQLGSFSSEAGARRAWGIYASKYPQLSGHEMVISEAVVRGKRYWRVSAAGFGRSTASSMCGQVRASGGGCIAYAEGRPLPGAVDTGVRLARR